ncbi:AzlD domain-containing protein [Paraliobacillus salinarum]|uniref:AzlD domain-containing protein n=1 Tax=Paraliobacillus salinarum TaxID=1158996 RepID=UPI0031B5C972
MVFIIIGMSLVTMIPRFLPIFIIDRIPFPKWVNQWLDIIPYAALGALIFPGVLSVIPDKPWIGLTGAVIAVILAIVRANVIIVVLGSTLTVFLFLML